MQQQDISATRYRNALTTVFPIVKNLMGGFGKRKLFPLIICIIDQNRFLLWIDSVKLSFGSFFVGIVCIIRIARFNNKETEIKLEHSYIRIVFCTNE